MPPAVTVEDSTVGVVEDALKLWGFSYSGAGRHHREFKDTTGKLVRLGKRRSTPVNKQLIREILNYLHVDPERFYAGPEVAPEPPAPEPTPSEPETTESTTEAPPAQPIIPSRAIGGTRAELINFLHSKGGRFADPKGNAVTAIAKTLGVGAPTLNVIARRMEADGQLIRDKIKPGAKEESLRKVYEIVLVEEEPAVAATITGKARVAKPRSDRRRRGAPAPTAPETPTAPEEVPEAPPEPPPPPPVIDERTLAVAVVDELVRRLTRESYEDALRERLNEARERIHRLTEYAQGLRSEKIELQEQLDVELRKKGGDTIVPGPRGGVVRGVGTRSKKL